MYAFTREEGLDLGALRERLAAMTDRQLIRYGCAAHYMAVHGSTRETFRVQLEAARAEWRRRHPKRGDGGGG
jgi:hypothetical protein